jgi:hypothetical protein
MRKSPHPPGRADPIDMLLSPIGTLRALPIFRNARLNNPTEMNSPVGVFDALQSNPFLFSGVCR